MKHGLACPIILVALCTPAAAQELPDFNNFGGTGILDMPSATMAPDGRLVMNASYQLNTQHYNFTFQALPWLETSFRYSGLTHFTPDFPVYWDRAFALKARLLEEGDVFPAIAVGINDLVGTGLYSGEYIVATKRFGSVEATVGMGFGRLGTNDSFRNPISLVVKSFETRPVLNVGKGGEFSFDTYFHGPASIFGGLIWHTPVENLTLKAEYSSDKYLQETASGNFTPKNQFSFGAAYRAFDNMIFALDWMYGRSLGGSITFDLSPNIGSVSQRLEPTPITANLRSPSDQALALQTLKGQPSRPMVIAAAGSVDDLWRIVPDLHNVAISGATLELTVPSPSQDLCGTVAARINATALNITGIAVRNETGARIFRCPANASASPFVQTTVYRPDAGATGIAAAIAAEPLVIDAAGPSRARQAQATAKLRADATAQNLRVEALFIQRSMLTIYYSNTHYAVEAEAIDKLLRVAMTDAPPEIEQFRFIAFQNGVALAEYDILRATAERNFDQEGLYDLLVTHSGPLPASMSEPGLAAASRSSYPRFSWSVFPQLRQEFFDPSNPLGFQLVGGAEASLELFRGFTLDGEVEASIFDTFNTARPADSVLPHVRTDFLQYFVHGKNGIGQLAATYRFRLSPTVSAAVRMGYLESMFGGVGGEILWRPEGQRWALGADLYEVKQRGYDRLFDFLPYRQTTGHVTIYYDSPWYDLNFQIRAGQYLAGDRGVTAQVSRRFSTGVEIGVFATKTNVSAARFGEGSFDKGIFIHIPLEWIMPIHTQISLDEMIRPVQRDGGQVLAGDATLFDFTRRTSEADAELMKWN